MAGPGICVLCMADTCVSEVHPVFNHVAPYGYMLPNMYLFTTDIVNPDYFVCCCRTWISLDITHFVSSSASHLAGLHGRLAQKMVNRSPIADKHTIQKGKMHSNCRLIPDHIVCKITQRNNIRRANTCDTTLK